MKTKIAVLCSILGLALVGGLAVAAPGTPPLPPDGPGGPGGPPDARHARMAERLGLTADQQKQIEALHAAQHAELQALTANAGLTPEARHDQARAVMEKYRSQIHAVLTPEQQKQADEMRGRAAHRGHGAGPEGRLAGEGRGGPGRLHPPFDPMAIVAMGERIKDRLAEKLQLTDEQRDKLDHLGRAYRAEQRELAKKHREEMRAVLTPEQQAKAEEMKRQWGRHAGARAEFDGPRPGIAGADEELEEMADDQPAAVEAD